MVFLGIPRVPRNIRSTDAQTKVMTGLDVEANVDTTHEFTACSNMDDAFNPAVMSPDRHPSDAADNLKNFSEQAIS